LQGHSLKHGPINLRIRHRDGLRQVGVVIERYKWREEKDADAPRSLRHCHCWHGRRGCAVASYLAEHTDALIALIEAGDMDRGPFIHIPAGLANTLVHDRHVWKYETVPQHGTKRAYR
jgi:hypothetical protein